MVDLAVPLHFLKCLKFELSPLIKGSNLLYKDRIYSRNKEQHLLLVLHFLKFQISNFQRLSKISQMVNVSVKPSVNVF